MRFLVFGSLNIDMTYHLDHIVRPGETTTSISVITGAGGKGANQAASLGKAGADVSFAGKIGTDGVWVLDKLKSFGVDVSTTIISNTIRTGNAIIQVDKAGENSIILSPGGNRSFTGSEIDDILASYGKGDVILLQNEINMLSEIITEAKDKGMTVCLNPSPYDEIIGTLPLDKVDMFFINELEAAELADFSGKPENDSDFRKVAGLLLKKFPHSSFVMTAGKNGAYYMKEGTVWFSPIVELPVVDTTGAGDTFSGYFLSAIQSGMDIQKSLDRASKAAAITVSRNGAMDSMPTSEEVDNLILD